ncbi:hypothetical protein HBI38_125970 [Parastagonospora nodorum]|nr:hypothetical protein HBI10_148490 [Parastagonospora nodorum]KAH4020053.1 hypothetical protein HBI13_121620 [Parastagonospora nodorum]KAH4937163.1 hypothetical protein HBH74_077390 [Parastagonospora nodorum]KAH4948494.1 hypothetical protein HBH73_123460 [Parastagonospora nodorum]KAH5007259.1 hypothetical protein HBI75_218700 [Parastagonospora nodorum]
MHEQRSCRRIKGNVADMRDLHSRQQEWKRVGRESGLRQKSPKLQTEPGASIMLCMGKTETLPHCVCKKALGFNLGRSRGYSHKSHVAWDGSRSGYEGMKHPAATLYAIRVDHGLASARIVKSDTRGARSEEPQTAFVSGCGRGLSYRWIEDAKVRAELLANGADMVCYSGFTCGQRNH